MIATTVNFTTAMEQITDHIIMIRPRHFGFNAETAANNTFQQEDGAMGPEEIAQKALEEFDQLVTLLRENGVHVDVVDDTDDPVKPDAVFPNNWFSTHQNGTVVTYPMMSPARRNERREDVIVALSDDYEVNKRYSFEVYEEYDQFLEGTGSLVLDREHRVAYACLSPRSEMTLIEKFCIVTGYTPLTFHALYDGKPVYHTNVVMALGATYVVICLECIPDPQEQKRLRESFRNTKKELIEITPKQMAAFAGNMIQLSSVTGEKLCVMSEQAYRSLSTEQTERLQQHNRILFSPVYVIEKYGGGSARCMIAENFLSRKKQ